MPFESGAIVYFFLRRVRPATESGPRLQAVPDLVPVVLFFFGKPFDVKFPEQVFEELAMQVVQVGPGPFPIAYLIHGRLVPGSPSIRKVSPVDGYAFCFSLKPWLFRQ